MALTKRQKEVLDYLVSFETRHGYSPSFEEIGKGMKLTSLATVHKHISTLEKKGFIRRGYNQSRSIEIVQLPKPVKEQVIERRIQELPLVGRIAAGRPLEAVEEREVRRRPRCRRLAHFHQPSLPHCPSFRHLHFRSR